MPSPSAERTVLVASRDLFFRAKLEALAAEAGYRTVREGPAALAVVELGDPDGPVLVRRLAESGVPVIAFGPHVQPQLLREARAAGATAVPASQVEDAVRRALARPPR